MTGAPQAPARAGTDVIERDYIRAIASATRQGDNDRANELAVGLREYRQSYKP